jgi:hypothetical protein
LSHSPATRSKNSLELSGNVGGVLGEGRDLDAQGVPQAHHRVGGGRGVVGDERGELEVRGAAHVTFVEEVSLAQDAQVIADAALGHLEDACELGHREFLLREQRENAQARGVGEDPQGVREIG